jgi:hypothetical protein
MSKCIMQVLCRNQIYFAPGHDSVLTTETVVEHAATLVVVCESNVLNCYIYVCIAAQAHKLAHTALDEKSYNAAFN